MTLCLEEHNTLMNNCRHTQSVDSDVLCGVRPTAATVRRRRVEIRFGVFETDRRSAAHKRRDHEDRQRAAAVAEVRHADVRGHQKRPRIH